MCSKSEDIPASSLKQVDSSVCVKCKTEKPIIVLRENDVMCRACFPKYFVHKFRAAIGKSKLIRENDLVLLAYSGGLSSTVLLELVKLGIQQGSGKRLRFKPAVIFIDESDVYDNEEREAMICSMSDIATVLLNSGFPCYVASLSDAACCDQDGEIKLVRVEGESSFDSWRSDAYAAPSDDALVVKCALEQAITLTSKQRLLEILRRRVMKRACRQLGYGSLMLADTSNRLAQRLFTHMSLGTAHNTCAQMAFCDDSDASVKMFHPMREFTLKEVAIYSEIMTIPVPPPPQHGTALLHPLQPKVGGGSGGGGGGTSLESVTDTFLANLQRRFPATVSTVLRSGEKMRQQQQQQQQQRQSVREEGGDCGFCKLCHATKEDTSDVKNCSAYNSIRFSSMQVAADTTDITSDIIDINRLLCYSCQLIVKDMNDTAMLKKLLK